MPFPAEIAGLLSPSDPVTGENSAPLTRLPRAPDQPRQLGALATRGGAYLTLRYGLSILVSIANMFLLTRWIGPHAYGLFVTAVGFTTFFASLTRFGVDTYLVRCDPAPDRQQYRVAFTLVLSNCIVLTIVGFAILPLLKRWYAGDEFSGPYLVLLLSVPLTGLAGIPVAKLERALNFRAAAGIELGGQVIALIMASVLALRGFGVWAPVTGLFAWQVFALLAACVAARFVPGLRINARDARQMLAFGLGFSASMRVWQLRSLVNPLLVGRFAGAEGVALVAIALRVAEGIGFVRTVAGRLAIAALARLQDDRKQLRQALEKALSLQVIVLGPLLCAFALCGPWLVPRIMGSRWTGLLTVYPFVAIGVLVSSVFNLQASALFVVGEQWTVLRAYACHVSLLALGTFLLVPRFGIAGYGWGELLACAGYVFIHGTLVRTTLASYRKLLPWVGLFVGILGLSADKFPAVSIWVATVAGIAVATAWTKAQRRTSQSIDLQAAQPPAKTAWQRAHTFLSKARVRGWNYVAALAHYYLAANLYQSRLTLERVQANAKMLLSLTERAEIQPSPSNVLCISSGMKNRRFHFEAADISHIVERIPAHLQRRTVSEAERILARRFCFRGHEEQLTPNVNWAGCPDGNLSWRWDLNRHRFFLSLGLAHYYTGQLCYLRDLIRLWNDWIETNPRGQGCNWKYPFEVAARLQNWLWAYFLLADSSLSRSLDIKKLEHALLEHARYVRAHLEYHWPNNHLLLEAKALCEFGMLFPDLDPGGVLGNQGQQILEKEVVKQILPDGTHAELSSMYHRIIAGELEELLALCDRYRIWLPDPVADRIRRMRKFSRALVRPDGSLPLLGDSAAEDTYLRFDSSRRDYSDLNYWLWPDPSLPVEMNGGLAASELYVFPQGGYGILTNSKGLAHVTFDFGAFSQCETSNHAHCDALSFELWANGQPVIVDPGIYFPWQEQAGWTEYFRGSGVHNTLELDGRPQAEPSEALDRRHNARSQLLRQVVWTDDAAIVAESIPQWCRKQGMRHTREIRLHDHTMTIRDCVYGSGVHQMAWSFQFAPEVNLTCHGRKLSGEGLQGKTLFTLSTQADREPHLQLFCGQKDPLRGWVSRSSYEPIPAPLACYSLKAELPFQMDYIFTL
jgi:O-antigen/teichoic acid export membrane protein